MRRSAETRIADVGLRLTEEDGALVELSFVPRAQPAPLPEGLLQTAAAQLEEYFALRRRGFDLPLRPHGTPFQLSVWDELRRIPYGETRSYLDLAQALGKPGAVRAVGAANGANPIGILIPCHRVIGSDGSLTGFGGGLPLKRRLLELEGSLPRAAAARQRSLF
jgi:methylated-DNA-[protein]-cysteine S-methyltransferase